MKLFLNRHNLKTERTFLGTPIFELVCLTAAFSLPRSAAVDASTARVVSMSSRDGQLPGTAQTVESVGGASLILEVRSLITSLQHRNFTPDIMYVQKHSGICTLRVSL